jgi:hypothetical protein
MNFEVVATGPFMRKLKKLSKKHKSLSVNIAALIDDLSRNPNIGIALGMNCYKIRLAITSKGQGKSGGARIITYVRVIQNKVYLMDIYDKSDQETITASELSFLIDLLSKD